MFIAAQFIIAKTWKKPRCPMTDEWIRKIYIYLYIFIYTHIYIKWTITQLFEIVK